MIRALLFAVLIWTAPLTAQVFSVTVQPPSPTTQSHVFIIVNSWVSCGPVTMTRTGDLIRIDAPSACVSAPQRTTLDAGFLPAGTYTYEVYVDDSFERSGSFVVAEAGAPSVPSLSLVAQCLLAAALGILGVIYLRRLS